LQFYDLLLEFQGQTHFVAPGSPLEDVRDEENERIPNKGAKECMSHLGNTKANIQLAGDI
jgi:hypothetical protein